MCPQRKWTNNARERLRADVMAEIRGLIAEGVYPSLGAIRARVDASEREIGRARADLIATGAVAVEIQGHALRERGREGREATKARLHQILRDRATRGTYPSVRDLAREFASDGLHEWLVREIRRELIEEGAYWMPPGRGSRSAEATRGLDGSTDESRAEIEATRLAIFAEKVDRGEEPAAGFRPARILTSPDYRFREDRR